MNLKIMYFISGIFFCMNAFASEISIYPLGLNYGKRDFSDVSARPKPQIFAAE